MKCPTSHCTGTTESWKRNGWKGESSGDCRKLVWTWHGVAVRSKHEQQRPETVWRTVPKH